MGWPRRINMFISFFRGNQNVPIRYIDSTVEVREASTFFK